MRGVRDGGALRLRARRAYEAPAIVNRYQMKELARPSDAERDLEWFNWTNWSNWSNWANGTPGS